MSIDSEYPAGGRIAGLSAAQTEILTAQTLSANPAIYTIAQSLTLGADLDLAAFRWSLNQVVRETETLHVRFLDPEDGPGQLLNVPPEWKLEIRADDLVQERDIEATVAALLRRPIEPSDAALFRFALISLADRSWLFLQCFHHLVMDGYSCAIFASRLAETYSSALNGVEVTSRHFGPFEDLLAADKRYRRSPEAMQDRAYWRATLAGVEPSSATADPGVMPTAAQILQTEVIAPAVALRWRAIAKTVGASIPHLLNAVTSVLLAATGGETDTVVGFATAARPDGLMLNIPGTVANVVAVRSHVDFDRTWREHLEATRKVTRDALDHQRARLEDVRRDLGMFGANAGLTPVVVNYIPFYAPLSFGGARAILRGRKYAPVDDFAIFAYFHPDEPALVMDFIANGGRRSEEELTLFRRKFRRLCDHLVADIDARVSTFALADADELQTVVLDFNETAVARPDATVPDLFAEVVRRTPDSPAIVFHGAVTTYAETDRRANRLARLLIEHGAGPEHIVAVAIERSDTLVLGLLAIAKAGAAYLALDAENPKDRLANVLADADPLFVLSSGAATAVLTRAVSETRARIPILDLNDLEKKEFPEDGSNDALVDDYRTSNLLPGHPVYICYTSGSTGHPKGVVVTHRDVADFVRDHRWHAEAKTRVLMHSPVAFDASTYEIWVPLLTGGSVVVMPPGTLDGPKLSRLVPENAVTDLWLTAGLFHLIGDTDPRAFDGLRQVLAGGDVLSAPIVNSVLEANRDLAIVNGYGPTETTTFVSTHRMTVGSLVGSRVPIGRPLDNMRVYVLDDRLKPLPPGVTGELYVAGSGLARGYNGRPDLTAERFVASPFAPAGDRLYRTGDRARWTAEGTLCFAGRSDGQIKLRGFRIEPGEIETALSELGIARSLVVLRDKGLDRAMLIAYVVDTTVDHADLRRRLSKRLPDYMVPSAFVSLDALPLTPNGKIDRRRLPAPTFGRFPLAPGTEKERRIIDLFAAALELETVGLDDNFFDDLGGNSLLALRIAGSIRRQLGIQIAPDVMFTAPTVRLLSEQVEALVAADERPSWLDTARSHVTPSPMSAHAQLSAYDIEDLLHSRFHDQPAETKAYVATVDGNGEERILYSPSTTDGAEDSRSSFPLGSISKFLASLLLCQMEQAGRIGIEDPLGSRLPADWNVSDTLRHDINMVDLATHTSGLPAFVPELEQATEPELRTYLECLDATAEDRAYRYCTFGIAMLGQALRKNESGAYLDVLKRYLLDPLGMTDTGSIRQTHVTGHGDETPFRFYECSRDMSSSIADLQKILVGFLSDRGCSTKAALARMVSVARPTGMPELDMTVGLRSRRTHGAHLLYHGGGGPGYRAFFGLAPDTRRGIVLLTNREIHIGDIGQHWLCSAYPLVDPSAARRKVAASARVETA